MNELEFKRLAAAGYNRIPVTLETFADLDTPLSIYLKLANTPYTYLLDTATLPAGPHLLTVNVLGGSDHYGVATRQVVIGAHP